MKQLTNLDKKKYIKHQVRQIFGQKGLNRLVITATSSNVRTNAFSFFGAWVGFYSPARSNQIYLMFYECNQQEVQLTNIVKERLTPRWDWSVKEVSVINNILCIPYTADFLNQFFSQIEEIKTRLGETWYRESVRLSKTSIIGREYVIPFRIFSILPVSKVLNMVMDFKEYSERKGFTTTTNDNIAKLYLNEYI